MVDRQLIARLEAARVSFCLIGALARAAHGCPPRDGRVELLTVDADVLRPLLWADGPRPAIELGAPGDPCLGRLRWDGAPPQELIVGQGHAMVFAADTAKPDPDLGCRVATPLGLILLALERGGPGDVRDVVELVRAQEARIGQPWRLPVEEHLQRMSRAATECWRRARVELGAPSVAS